LSKFIIAEIITTGFNFKQDKIIHISLISIQDGKITDEFTTFINPQRSLENDLLRPMSLSYEVLHQAPRFFEIAKTILNKLQDTQILSANPRFTYTFLKNEFQSLGFYFNHPYSHINKYIQYDSSTIFSGLTKAKNIADLFVTGIPDDNKPNKSKEIAPKFFLENEIKSIPNVCGVYLLKNQNGQIIYIGKALKIRNRIREHFRDLNNKGFSIHRKVADIDHVETPGELWALLLEMYLIQKHRPELNKALRNVSFKYVLKLQVISEIEKLVLSPIEKNFTGLVIKKYKSRKSGISHLEQLILDYEIPLVQIQIFGKRKLKITQNVDCDERKDLSSIVQNLNPFSNGRYALIDKNKGEAYCLVENGTLLGFSFNSSSDLHFYDFYAKLEYPFSHPAAISLIIKYQKSNGLYIKKFDI
jgi:DNA polymerase-3 subunit epsilon